MIENVTILRKNIKNVYIRIGANAQVHVSVPKFFTQTSIDNILRKKTPWILQKQEAIKNQKKCYEKDTILYLGKQYKALHVSSSKESVTIDDENSTIYSAKENFLDEWYQQEALKLFDSLVQKYEKIIGKKVEKLRIKKMRSRWGSCNHAKRYINLNLHLIKTPLASIEYVVLHELAHLIHPNHSKSFYGLIEKHMEDWRERKRILENFRIAYM